MKISVLMCLKNSGDYIEYMKQIYTELENKYDNIIFEYFFYENNSTDNTEKNLIDFKNIVKGNCHLILEDTPPPPKFKSISLERGQFVINMRNKFKDRIGKLDSDYVFYIDDDVYFKIDHICDLISKMKTNVKMVVSNGICLNTTTVNDTELHHHYDTLAFISLDDISYKQTNNSCLNKPCRICSSWRRHHRTNLDEKYLIDMNNQDTIEIKSGFGSCSLIETNMFNKVNFTNDKEEIRELEWPSLCKNIRDNGGKIVLSCQSKALVVTKDYNYINDKVLIWEHLNKL